MMISSSSAAARLDPVDSWWFRSGWGRWLFLSAIWLMVAGLFALQQMVGRELDWRMVVGFSLLDWGPWLLLSPLVIWLATRVRIDGRNWRRTVPVHIASALVITVALEFSADYFMHRVLPPPEALKRMEPPPDELGRPRPTPPRFVRARLTIPVYFLLVAAAHAVAYHRRSLERERRALTAEARLAESRLMALQTQIHPHFLFNTLNAISSLIYTQPQAADEMLCALSELLRSVLDTAERREITLSEELAFVDRYLAIQQIRFADRLTVHREIAPEIAGAAVPTLILQPLVENAVIHGIAPRRVSGVVAVNARRVGDRLLLSVADTGRGDTLPPTADGGLVFEEHVGLSNTRARLATLYGDEAHLKLAAAPGGSVVASLDLPYRLLAQ